MMPMTAPNHPGNDTITVVRAALVAANRYNAQHRDWPGATSTVVRGVAVQPIGAVETDAQREYAATHMRLFAPYTIDLTSTDRVVWNDITFEVDGEPARWHDDSGQPDHVEVDLKRMTG